MDVALWVVQGLLALMFLMAGGMKAARPKAELAERMGWVNDFSDTQVKLIGVIEVLGALGLILPMLLVAPFLTPIAALGLAMTMAGAAYTHYRRGEMNMLAMPIILMLLSLFVVYGRFDLLVS